MRKPCSRSRRWIAVSLALLNAACSWRHQTVSFGLDNVAALEISSEKLSVIKTGSYTKSRVWATVWLNGEPFRAQVNYAGATSVDDLKRSYALKLEQPFRGRTAYRLNAMNGDPSAMRALLSYRAFALGGFEMPDLEPIAVWLNDDYAGLYLLQELYDETYFARRGQIALQLYQAEDSMATLAANSNLELSFSVKLGSDTRADLERLVTTVDSGSIESLAQQIDVGNVLKYLAISQRIDNWDGISNNYFLVRTEREPRFRVLPWDLDRTLHDAHAGADGEFFSRNALFQRLSSEAANDRRFANAAAELDWGELASHLSEYAGSIAVEIGDAYANDVLLSNGTTTLAEQLDSLRSVLEPRIGP